MTALEGTGLFVEKGAFSLKVSLAHLMKTCVCVCVLFFPQFSFVDFHVVCVIGIRSTLVKSKFRNQYMMC